MMEYICHRVNTLGQLRELPPEFGAEVDLRDNLDGRIYIQHNPFEAGEDFEKYLQEYRAGTMICNIKSERIELKVLEMLQQYRITDFFFLDSSFPVMYLLSGQGEHRMALRLSEYEGMDTVRAMAGKADWVWADCFTRFPLDAEICREIKQLGYRICLVSPELQGQPEKIEVYAERMKRESIEPDAVCTKYRNIKKWERFFHES